MRICLILFTRDCIQHIGIYNFPPKYMKEKNENKASSTYRYCKFLIINASTLFVPIYEFDHNSSTIMNAHAKHRKDLFFVWLNISSFSYVSVTTYTYIKLDRRYEIYKQFMQYTRTCIIITTRVYMPVYNALRTYNNVYFVFFFYVYENHLYDNKSVYRSTFILRQTTPTRYKKNIYEKLFMYIKIFLYI